jgi:hypothetical protein
MIFQLHGMNALQCIPPRLSTMEAVLAPLPAATPPVQRSLSYHVDPPAFVLSDAVRDLWFQWSDLRHGAK